MTVFTAIVELTKASWRVLRLYPRLMWFPILSLLGTLGILALVVPVLPGMTDWAAIFVLLFALHLVHAFFAVALTSEALRALRGEAPITIANGISTACTRVPAIASYAAVSATVGFVLEILGRSNSSVLRFARTLFGTGWSLVTYLAIPVMVQERRDGIASMRRSGDLFRQTWGETALSEVGLRVLAQYAFFLLVLLAILLLHVLDGEVLAVLLVIGLFGALIGLIGSLEAIYRAALYVFASEGVVPAPFASAELDEIWRTKPAEPQAPPPTEI